MLPVQQCPRNLGEENSANTIREEMEITYNCWLLIFFQFDLFTKESEGIC
jgi:hypothetical protein